MTVAERRQQLEGYRAHYVERVAQASTPAAKRAAEQWVRNADRALAKLPPEDGAIPWVAT